MTIEYREIPGCPGYRAGTDGSIWSQWGRRGGWEYVLTEQWKPIRPKTNKQRGYLEVQLRTSPSKSKMFKVHRLVLEAFVGACPAGMECCHGDGVPANCRIDNLRWDTRKNNAADRVRHGTHQRGERASRRKLSLNDVQEIRKMLADGSSRKSAAEKFGVTPANIYCIVHGKSWKKFEDELNPEE